MSYSSAGRSQKSDALMSYRREEQPLDIHLWFLGKFLIKSKFDMKALQLYVVAASFKKIRRRMNDSKQISKFNYDSLVTLDVVEFPEFSEPPPNRTSQAAKDEELLKVLPTIHKHLPSLPMSNLLRQVELANGQGPYNIYTEDTRIEFHMLLCELLRLFKLSLDTLKLYHEKETILSEPSKFEPNLSTVLFYGSALQLLSRGSAIDNHLKAIEPLLRDRRRDKSADVKLRMTEEIEEEEVDAELEGTTEQPLWESYRDWLRLMVVHFEAVSVLVGHIAGPRFQSNEIIIKILSAPRSSQEMQPWEELLNSKYFPVHTPNNAPNASLKDILTSLRTLTKYEGPKTNSVEEVLLNLRALLTPDSENPSEPVVGPSDEPANAPAVGLSPKLKKIIKQLQSIKDCNSPARDNCIKDITSTLSNLPSQAAQSQESIRGVIHMLQSLRDGAKIFKQLRKNALGKGVGFTGSLHCELVIACLIMLASFIPSTDVQATGMEDILKEFKVSCIVLAQALQDASDIL